MKTLIRKTSTALYFEGPDKWTQNPSEALNFKSIDRGLDFISRWDLKGVELVFAFDDDEEVKEVEPEKLRIDFVEHD